MRDDVVVHVGDVYESKWSYVLEVHEVDFIMPCYVTNPSVELLFLLCFIAAWTCVVVSVRLVVCSSSVFPIYVSVCFVCFMLDCVGELFVECVSYLCG